LLKSLAVSIIYSGIMIGSFIAISPNPDKITALVDMINGFRIMSMLTITIFWIVLRITFGLIWDKLKPHETPQFSNK
jgi:predicted cobalt transporter CbtA